MKTVISNIFRIIILTAFSLTVYADNAALGKTAGVSDLELVKATIGVMAHSDFVPDRVKPQSGTKIGLPEVLADRIIQHLSTSRRFDVVERTALRRLVLEQRFGARIQKNYLDRSLDKAIAEMPKVTGSTVGTTSAFANYNDHIKDYQDLGAAAGADYLVLGDLEKLERSTKTTAVPYSTEGRTHQQKKVDARLNLRVIDANKGTIAGVTSIRAKLTETIFEGKTSSTDQFSFIDQLGKLAAARILDVTFPARIVSLEPLVISRGKNEGVKKGALFLIEREGKELKDANGIVIANLKSKVGKVQVENPQETVAVVKLVAGGDFKVGDLAIPDTESKSLSESTMSEKTVPLTPAVQSTQLPRVAIGLVKSGSTARTGKDAQEHTPIFTDTMISRLAQTKRFKMIDRQEADQLINEQLAAAMSNNQQLPSAMGSLKGADYLVYGSLASFGTEDKTVRLPYSSRTIKKKVGYVEGNMRIVNSRTGDVMESRKISVKQDVDAKAKGTRTVAALADAYAEQVTLMLMNAIYPIKVAHVSGNGTVYINRGDDGGLYVGEFLDAFRPGQTIIDPDTGVQFGVEETLIGQVNVTEVEDARSKGVITEGASLLKGDILKRALENKGKRSSEAVTERDSAPTRTGGALPSSQVDKSANAPLAKPTLAMVLLRLNSSAKTTGLTKGHLQRMSDDMILKLLNTNRFELMERHEVDKVIDEKAYESVASGGDIQDRLGELQGADYLIHGEVANFYLDVKKTKVPYVNETKVTVTQVAEGMFRIVDVHTGKVASAEKVRIREKVTNVDDANQIMSNLMEKFTTESVALIVDRLYPIKVLGMTPDGVVYLNRGEDAGLVRGARFEVMRPGAELIDPDTGRSFGASEMKVGAVELIAVEANRSRAQFITGSNAQSGDILRKPQVVQKKTQPVIRQPAW